MNWLFLIVYLFSIDLFIYDPPTCNVYSIEDPDGIHLYAEINAEIRGFQQSTDTTSIDYQIKIYLVPPENVQDTVKHLVFDQYLDGYGFLISPGVNLPEGQDPAYFRPYLEIDPKNEIDEINESNNTIYGSKCIFDGVIYDRN